MKWNNINTLHNKIYTDWYITKQISVYIFKNNFISCSKWTTVQQCRGSVWPLRDWSYGWQILLVLLIVGKNAVFYWLFHFQVVNANGEKWVSNPGLKKASPSNWRLSQSDSVYSRLNAWYALVSMLYAPIFESTQPRISVVPWWLVVIGSLARCRWLYKKYCLCDNNMLQAARTSLGKLLSFLRRDFLPSVWLNLVQIRETNQFRRWRLRISCFSTVDWKCWKWEWKWSFG